MTLTMRRGSAGRSRDFDAHLSDAFRSMRQLDYSGCIARYVLRNWMTGDIFATSALALSVNLLYVEPEGPEAD
ncbi:MAG: hypothetical protein BGO16_12230 [Nitrobacter sp. 62-23]|nr:MAG: hypothetical protein BGO16_12230 [Nitrobacter sp. 62-23]